MLLLALHSYSISSSQQPT